MYGLYMSYWLQDMKMNKGAFTKQAKRRNMTPKQFSEFVIKHKKNKNSGYTPTMRTYRRALLTKTLLKMNKKKKHKKHTNRAKGRKRTLRTKRGNRC